MEQIERIIATKVLIKVNGFYDAKNWMYRILQAGIATCSSCDKPANRIHWVDRAEWYFECDEHWSGGDMWVGHTGWNPSVLSKRVIPELASAWVKGLPPIERKLVRLKEYDATDWYEWLTDDEWKNPDEIILNGTPEWGAKVKLRPLKNGQYAYQISTYSPGYSYTKELIAPFDTREDALNAAKAQVEQR